MIYLDTSVALAQLLGEERFPPASLWSETLVSSRLLEYELWVRLNARGLHHSHAEIAQQLIARLAFVEMVPQVLERALDPFPTTVRTLDAIHLASVDFLMHQRQGVRLATYDKRLREAAARMDISIYDA